MERAGGMLVDACGVTGVMPGAVVVAGEVPDENGDAVCGESCGTEFCGERLEETGGGSVTEG